MKRILFITAFVPSRIGAGENFSRQLINDIAENNNIDLIYFKYSGDDDYATEREKVKVLKIFRNSILIKIFNIILFPFLFPLFTVRFNFARMLYIKRLIKKTRYDLVVLDFSQTFLFAKFINDIPIILNCHDVIAQRYSRIYHGLLEPFVRISEKYVLSGHRITVFNHSEKDSALLQKHYSIVSRATTIFIDKTVMDSVPEKVGNYFVFFANWSRPDNSKGLEWFLKNVYPHLMTKNIFKIIGSGLPVSILEMIKRSDSIEYLGFINDPYPVISDSLALISPLFTGAGIKVKVLESLACGTFVIGTSVSFEGISEIYSRYLIHAENPGEFISVLNGFKTDISEKAYLKKLFLGSYSRNTISEYINGSL